MAVFSTATDAFVRHNQWLIEALRDAPQNPDLWLLLAKSTPELDPLGALAAAQLACTLFDAHLLANATGQKAVDRATRRALLLPFRVVLVERLLQQRYYADARYHFLGIASYPASLLARLPELTAPLPRFRQWLAEGWRPMVYQADDRVPGLADKLAVLAWRLLAPADPVEGPATVLEKRTTWCRLLLRAPLPVAGTERLVWASSLAYPSLAAAAPGDAVQVRLLTLPAARLTQVIALARRPGDPPWSGTRWRPAVVHRCARATEDPSGQDRVRLLFGPTLAEQLWIPLNRWSLGPAAWPQAGDAVEARVPDDPALATFVCALQPSATPDPALHRSFRASLYEVGADYAFVGERIFLHRTQLPPEAWREGQPVEGIAAPFYDRARDRIAWRAIRISSLAIVPSYAPSNTSVQSMASSGSVWQGTGPGSAYSATTS